MKVIPFFIIFVETINIMERTFNKKEVEEMCKQSYMRGMSIQHDTMIKKKMKPLKVFTEWVKQLIDECPVGKFK